MNPETNVLTITKEKVLEAAEKCSTAKEVLRTMFPEVFKNDKYFKLDKVRQRGDINSDDGTYLMCVRTVAEYAGKSFYLNEGTNKSINWEIKRDMNGKLCLVPTKE